MGVGTPDEFGYDGDVDTEILGSTASVSNMTGQGTILFGPYRAASGTANTLSVSDRVWAVDQFRVSAMTINIVAGTGAGQTRTISANSQNTVMVSTNWSTVPDVTSIFEIRRGAQEVFGEPSSLYDRRANAFIEKRGSYYGVNYQIQIIGATPEQVVYLTTIVRAIFTIMRTYLEGQGIINLKMSATDFVPRTEYQPDFAYMRALSLEFLTPFEIFEEMAVASQIRIAIETTSVDIGGEVQVVSDTTLSVGQPNTEIGP